MINDRKQLAEVFQQTIDIVLEGHYTSENGETRQHRARCIRLRCLSQSSETYRKTVSRSHQREGVQGQVQAHRLRHS